MVVLITKSDGTEEKYNGIKAFSDGTMFNISFDEWDGISILCSSISYWEILPE